MDLTPEEAEAIARRVAELIRPTLSFRNDNAPEIAETISNQIKALLSEGPFLDMLVARILFRMQQGDPLDFDKLLDDPNQ